MSKKNAVMLILLGGTFMSFVGLYMRLLTDANGFQILFYRSLSLCAIVGLVSCLRRRIGPVQFLQRLDQADFKMGSALALAFTCYVFAMLYTTVASTLFILSAAPFMAAVIGWVWINEKPQNITWVAMIFASCGVYLMVREGVQLPKLWQCDGPNFRRLFCLNVGSGAQKRQTRCAGWNLYRWRDLRADRRGRNPFFRGKFCCIAAGFSHHFDHGRFWYRHRHCLRYMGGQLCSGRRSQPFGFDRKRSRPRLAVDFLGRSDEPHRTDRRAYNFGVGRPICTSQRQTRSKTKRPKQRALTP